MMEQVKQAQVNNILAFMAVEYENTLVSSLFQRSHLSALGDIDGLYRHPREHLVVPNELAPIASLMLFCHFQMYMSFSNFMRCHLTYALVGVRKAIDAGLTAYVLIENPARMPDYLAKHNNFVYIKRHIAKLREADPKAYPIADVLLKTHEMGSQYGAHVDIETLTLMTVQRETVGGVIQDFNYFNVLPKNATDLMLVDSLFSFIEILGIFAPFVEKYAKAEVNYEAWWIKFTQIRTMILNELARMHKVIEAEGPGQ